MEITKEMLCKVKNTLDFMLANYSWFVDYAEELTLNEGSFDEIVKTQQFEFPEIELPGDAGEDLISLEDFLELADEIPHIEISSDVRLVKTKLKRYYIAVGIHELPEGIILPIIEANDKYRISVIQESFIVALAATRLGFYDEDLLSVRKLNDAIEITYYNESDILQPQEELDLVKSYIFEIADTFNVAITLGHINDMSYDLYDMIDVGEKHTYKLRELEPHNEGMKLFVSAIQINEQELKFLNFYKILEHYAPIAINIEAHELMRKKLDVSKSNFDNGDYIKSIYDLAKSVRDRYNDEDLIKTTINNCFDLVGIFKFLPDSVKKRVKKQISEQEINYSIDKQKIITASNMVGKILYSTRNRVVHAKSNYVSTEIECSSQDMEQLNVFMKEACSQTIRWYNRQPSHIQLSIIK